VDSRDLWSFLGELVLSTRTFELMEIDLDLNKIHNGEEREIDIEI
jgi:hypothetical protein